MQFGPYRILKRSMEVMSHLMIRDIQTKLCHCQTISIQLLISNHTKLGANHSQVDN